jgi:hypothetical protein
MLTSEFEPATLLAIIRHQQEKQKNVTPLEKHLSLYRFCLQAGWLAEAEAELTATLKELPAETEKVEKPLAELRRALAEERLDEIELASQSGRHQKAQRLLAAFQEEGATEVVLKKVRAARARYKEFGESLESLRRLLPAVRHEARDALAVGQFAPVLDEIERDVNLDTLPRVEAFVRLAAQEERSRQAGRAAELQPEQLLALAASGWLMGPNGADSQVSAVLKLVQARQFALAYLRTPDAARRAQLLDTYSKGEALRPDVVAQILDLLPPPLLDPQLPSGAVDLVAEAFAAGKPTPYRVQLPLEYHHHRAHPMLLVLHNLGEEPKDVLAKWSPLAEKHGYVLVAPRWAGLLKEAYGYAAEEHLPVLDVLRDVQRRYHIDSDRVILAGYDHGASAAYDIGLSHPDLFAGVVSMCGRPWKEVASYRHNAQHLPFYVIDGDKNGDGPKDNRVVFESWIPWGFPSLYVEYYGRGKEFYTGELPYVFEWMDRKKRPKVVPEFGRPDTLGGALGEEFRSLRPGDNRFYWVGAEELTFNGAAPAKFSGQAMGNTLVVRTSGVKQLVLWLGPTMVDFEQPVEIKVNPGSAYGKTVNKPVEPSLKVLLEEYYARADRKNLVTARVEVRL